MWDKRVLEKIGDMVDLFSVSIRLKGLENGYEWACSWVYGPNR